MENVVFFMFFSCFFMVLQAKGCSKGRFELVFRGEEEAIEVLSGHSSRLSLEEKAELIVTETFGVLLLSEGCLESLAHARRHLAAPAVVPRGGAQAARLLSCEALRGYEDTGRVHCAAPGGFCVNALPGATWMSQRVHLFEALRGSKERRWQPLAAVGRWISPPAAWRTSQRAVPRRLECLECARGDFRLRAACDGHVDAVVLSWEVWADEEKTEKLSTHAEDTKDRRRRDFSLSKPFRSHFRSISRPFRLFRLLLSPV